MGDEREKSEIPYIPFNQNSDFKKWYHISECLPEFEEESCGLRRSRYVLLWLGTYAMVGYLEEWEDTSPHWILAGRDGYSANGVTRWQWIREPTETSI